MYQKGISVGLVVKIYIHSLAPKPVNKKNRVPFFSKDNYLRQIHFSQSSHESIFQKSLCWDSEWNADFEKLVVLKMQEQVQ